MLALVGLAAIVVVREGAFRDVEALCSCSQAAGWVGVKIGNCGLDLLFLSGWFGGRLERHLEIVV